METTLDILPVKMPHAKESKSELLPKKPSLDQYFTAMIALAVAENSDASDRRISALRDRVEEIRGDIDHLFYPTNFSAVKDPFYKTFTSPGFEGTE